MRTYILIKGTGSGKSTVAGMSQKLGCIDLDAVSHDVLVQPQTAADKVRQFGRGCLCRTGPRPALFSTTQGTAALYGIAQLRIVDCAFRQLARLKRVGLHVAVVEISLYADSEGVLSTRQSMPHAAWLPW